MEGRVSGSGAVTPGLSGMWWEGWRQGSVRLTRTEEKTKEGMRNGRVSLGRGGKTGTEELDREEEEVLGRTGMWLQGQEGMIYDSSEIQHICSCRCFVPLGACILFVICTCAT